MIKNNMYSEAKQTLSRLVAEGYLSAAEKGELSKTEIAEPAVEVPKDSRFGDLSSNFALSMAKPLRMAPRKIAEIIVSNMKRNALFSSYSVDGPGFINAFLGPEWYASVLETASAMSDRYGYDDIGKGQKVMVEFVSANPTGPMHLGNARGGVLGDSLSSVLERAGYRVSREFYVNDAGNQVDLYGKSVEARYIQQLKGEDSFPFPENGYHGDDIKERAAELIAEHGDEYLNMDAEKRQKLMREYGIKKNIELMRADLARYKVEYDTWFYESSLHENGEVKETVDILKKNGMLYEKDGALWFKGTLFGMEKDEVIVKSNGFYTYYAVDIAYHRNKFLKRGFDKVVDVFGADHHGHVIRFKAGMQALGIDPSKLDFVLYQLVDLQRNGESVRMSKRTGKVITLSNLLDEISVDAVRFFFNSRQNESHLEFDLDLAVKEDSDNPVYYVQYAHARICTMLKKLAEAGLFPSKAEETDIGLLSEQAEKALIKQIAMLPEEIRLAARDYEPFRLTRYLVELATAFHSFYTEVRIKDAEEKTARARLMLCDVTRSVLSNVLSMLKISAPEQM